LPQIDIESGFKTILINFFIIMLTRVNPARDPSLDQLSEICSRPTPIWILKL